MALEFKIICVSVPDFALSVMLSWTFYTNKVRAYLSRWNGNINASVRVVCKK
jgi:hypothetical protein